MLINRGGRSDKRENDDARLSSKILIFKKIRKRKKLSREGIYSFSLILLHTDAHTNVNSLTPV